MFSHKDCMTNAQLELTLFAEQEAEKDYLFCREQYEKAKAARVPLPHTNERGTSVLAGANSNISAIKDYWEHRMSLNFHLLSDEFKKKHIYNK
ncbi:hypothetical protein D3C81_384730 [compost metagenome]